jgi:hypothetical protein
MKNSAKKHSTIPVVITPIALACLLMAQVAMADGSVIAENINRIFDPSRLTAGLHAERQTSVEPTRNVAEENIAALFDPYSITARIQSKPAADPASRNAARDTAMDNIRRIFKADGI